MVSLFTSLILTKILYHVFILYLLLAVTFASFDLGWNFCNKFCQWCRNFCYALIFSLIVTNANAFIVFNHVASRFDINNSNVCCVFGVVVMCDVVVCVCLEIYLDNFTAAVVVVVIFVIDAAVDDVVVVMLLLLFTQPKHSHHFVVVILILLLLFCFQKRNNIKYNTHTRTTKCK